MPEFCPCRSDGSDARGTPSRIRKGISTKSSDDCQGLAGVLVIEGFRGRVYW